MKNNHLLLSFTAILMFISVHLSAQVSISTNNSNPDPSAMLDVKSTTKGILVPRMTAGARDSIINPAKGLLIFCSGNNAFYTNTGTPASPHWQGLGSQWVSAGENIFYNQGNVGIGTSSPMSKLDVNGTVALNDQELRLRGGGDGSHGLKYDAQAEGPYLFGWVGGALGTAGSPNSLEWNFLGDVAAKNNFYAAKFVTVDNSGINNGTFNSGLQFGPSSGEGIGSNRSEANNLYGLDFYTAGNNRMSITNGGNVGIGTANPNHALLQVQGMVGNTVALFSGGAATKGVSVVSDWPGIFFNSYFNGGNKAMSASGYPCIINTDQNTGGIAFNTTNIANTAANASVTVPERMRVAGNGSVGIGTAVPANSALVDMTSTEKGMLLPRMNTTQMNAISSPEEGLMVYNTTLSTMCWFNGTEWKTGLNVTGNSCGNPFYGGLGYATVIIGTQCWMKTNLNYGTAIPGTQAQANNGVIEKYCYNNNSANCNIYGGLYQWNEAMNYTTSSGANPSGRQGICPTGWHLPSDAEWCQLTTYLDPTMTCGFNGTVGTEAGGKLKEAGTSHWADPNVGGVNSNGFTGRPGGASINAGTFAFLNHNGMFWSATESDSFLAWYRGLEHASAAVNIDPVYKTNGFSVRCCKD